MQVSAYTFWNFPGVHRIPAVDFPQDRRNLAIERIVTLRTAEPPSFPQLLKRHAAFLTSCALLWVAEHLRTRVLK